MAFKHLRAYLYNAKNITCVVQPQKDGTTDLIIDAGSHTKFLEWISLSSVNYRSVTYSSGNELRLVDAKPMLDFTIEMDDLWCNKGCKVGKFSKGGLHFTNAIYECLLSSHRRDLITEYNMGSSVVSFPDDGIILDTNITANTEQLDTFIPGAIGYCNITPFSITIVSGRPLSGGELSCLVKASPDINPTLIRKYPGNNIYYLGDS